MALGIEQLDDFVASYLQRYPMGKWQDISLPLQEYMFASRLFDSANKREMSTSQCKWKLKIDKNDNFQVVGLYHRDSSSRVNVLTEGELKWGMTTTNYHYDIDEETFAQGASAIVNYLNLQEQGMMQDFFAGIEDLMFGAGPSSSTQSPFPPVSLLWWITSTDDSTSENNAEEGFDGYEPVGWTDVGGINPATYASGGTGRSRTSRWIGTISWRRPSTRWTSARSSRRSADPTSSRKARIGGNCSPRTAAWLKHAVCSSWATTTSRTTWRRILAPSTSGVFR